MLHHAFGPHFLDPAVFPGIPNLLLLLIVGVAIWYFLIRKKESQTEPNIPTQQWETDPVHEKKIAELETEITRLRIENELLQKMLTKRQEEIQSSLDLHLKENPRLRGFFFKVSSYRYLADPLYKYMFRCIHGLYPRQRPPDSIRAAKKRDQY